MRSFLQFLSEINTSQNQEYDWNYPTDSSNRMYKSWESRRCPNCREQVTFPKGTIKGKCQACQTTFFVHKI